VLYSFIIGILPENVLRYFIFTHLSSLIIALFSFYRVPGNHVSHETATLGCLADAGRQWERLTGTLDRLYPVVSYRNGRESSDAEFLDGSLGAARRFHQWDGRIRRNSENSLIVLSMPSGYWSKSVIDTFAVRC
jgi:hypothetical protein